MTRDSLIIFMKRILECGSAAKSNASLNQLKEILEMQNADNAMVDLVKQTLVSLPEAKSAAKEPTFTEESLRIAIRRAEDRKRREAEMASRGRC